MTILKVLFLTVVSTCLAQPADHNAKQRSARAPQSQIQYSDPDGTKVDWKLYAPQNQWRSHLESSRRLQREETGTGQPGFSAKQQPHVYQAPIEVEPRYQPFSAVPNHIKQLIGESYNYQGPYVDPGAFFYQAFPAAPVASLAASPEANDQTAHPQTQQLEREYFKSAVNYRSSAYNANSDHFGNGQIGRVPPRAGIKYKDEERLTQRSTPLAYGSVIGAQSREKSQYQPYKQISQPQSPQHNGQAFNSQFSQYNKQTSDSQFSQYNKQDSQIQPRFQQQTYQINSQRGQSGKQGIQQQYKQQAPIKPVSQTNFDKNMPMAIQQLLNYQAQLPYNVIANHIAFRPKQLFIPKPLPESAKLSKQYPSKIYFLKTDGQVYDNPDFLVGEKNAKGY